jgi:AcrR family transcriptional regulator
MSKAERRLQLLDAAFDLIRTDGTAALTLFRLAEVAGVARPVVYEHFGTREGLLLALYQRFDEVLGHTIDDALARGVATLRDAANVVAAAYVDAVVEAGPECSAVTAALSGRPETETFRETSRQFYVERLRAAFRPYAPGGDDTAVLVGILGALESLAHEALTGRASAGEAVEAAVTIIVGALEGGPAQPMPEDVGHAAGFDAGNGR